MRTTPLHDFFLKLSNQNVLDRELIERKSRSAVIEKLPQLATDVEDIDRIKSIVSECKLLDKLDPSYPPHRHSSTANNLKTCLILAPKLLRSFLLTKNHVTYFFIGFNIAKRKNSSKPSNVFCRRDLTPLELDYLYKLRKHAYNSNKACGLFKYVVRDLQIVELPNPKPLRAQNH